MIFASHAASHNTLLSAPRCFVIESALGHILSLLKLYRRSFCLCSDHKLYGSFEHFASDDFQIASFVDTSSLQSELFVSYVLFIIVRFPFRLMNKLINKRFRETILRVCKYASFRITKFRIFSLGQSVRNFQTCITPTACFSAQLFFPR